jgi:hypothetical protein
MRSPGVSNRSREGFWTPARNTTACAATRPAFESLPWRKPLAEYGAVSAERDLWDRGTFTSRHEAGELALSMIGGILRGLTMAEMRQNWTLVQVI